VVWFNRSQARMQVSDHGCMKAIYSERTSSWETGPRNVQGGKRLLKNAGKARRWGTRPTATGQNLPAVAQTSKSAVS